MKWPIPPIFYVLVYRSSQNVLLIPGWPKEQSWQPLVQGLPVQDREWRPQIGHRRSGQQSAQTQ